MAGVAYRYGRARVCHASPIIPSLSRKYGARNRGAYVPFAARDTSSARRRVTVIMCALAGNRNTDGSFNNRASNANLWSSQESGGNDRKWVRSGNGVNDYSPLRGHVRLQKCRGYDSALPQRHPKRQTDAADIHAGRVSRSGSGVNDWICRQARSVRACLDSYRGIFASCNAHRLERKMCTVVGW